MMTLLAMILGAFLTIYFVVLIMAGLCATDGDQEALGCFIIMCIAGVAMCFSTAVVYVVMRLLS